MLNYIFGRVVSTGLDSIIVDANNIGYELVVSHPNSFKKDELIKVHVFMQVKEDEFVLFGFPNDEEKSIFKRLISVSGIGPKTAINMLTQTTVDVLITAIETSNTTYLKKLPGIGPKAAQQIILDLKGKLVFDNYNNKGEPATIAILNDVREGLRNLGFRVAEIDSVLSILSKEKLSSEEYLKQALKLLRK
jgi:Holliday junction DNA helicase RuvA